MERTRGWRPAAQFQEQAAELEAPEEELVERTEETEALRAAAEAANWGGG